MERALLQAAANMLAQLATCTAAGEPFVQEPAAQEAAGGKGKGKAPAAQAPADKRKVGDKGKGKADAAQSESKKLDGTAAWQADVLLEARSLVRF